MLAPPFHHTKTLLCPPQHNTTQHNTTPCPLVQTATLECCQAHMALSCSAAGTLTQSPLTYAGGYSEYLQAQVNSAQYYSSTPGQNKFGWYPAACTTAYDYICEVPHTSLRCNAPPPVPPPSPPTNLCEAMLCCASGHNNVMMKHCVQNTAGHLATGTKALALWLPQVLQVLLFQLARAAWQHTLQYAPCTTCAAAALA